MYLVSEHLISGSHEADGSSARMEPLVVDGLARTFFFSMVLILKVNKFREYSIQFVDPPAGGMCVEVGVTVGGGKCNM